MPIEMITFPLVAGIITNLVTALINRVGWSSKIKTYVALATALVLTIAGVVFQLFPQAWPTVAAGIAAVFGVSQALYPVLKPILSKLEEATTGKTDSIDELDAIIAEILPASEQVSWDEDTPLGDGEQDEVTRGKHALEDGSAEATA